MGCSFCARHCSKYFKSINSSYPITSPRRQSHYHPYTANRKLKHRHGKQLAQGHWTIEWPRWDLHICVNLAQSAHSSCPTADVQSGQSRHLFWKLPSRTINSTEVMYFPQNIILFYLDLLIHNPRLVFYQPVWLHDQENSQNPPNEDQKSSFRKPGQLILGPSKWPSVVPRIPKAQIWAWWLWPHPTHPWPREWGCSMRFAVVNFLLCLERL